MAGVVNIARTDRWVYNGTVYHPYVRNSEIRRVYREYLVVWSHLQIIWTKGDAEEFLTAPTYYFEDNGFIEAVWLHGDWKNEGTGESLFLDAGCEVYFDAHKLFQMHFTGNFLSTVNEKNHISNQKLLTGVHIPFDDDSSCQFNVSCDPAAMSAAPDQVQSNCEMTLYCIKED